MLKYWKSIFQLNFLLHLPLLLLFYSLRHVSLKYFRTRRVYQLTYCGEPTNHVVKYTTPSILEKRNINGTEKLYIPGRYSAQQRGVFICCPRVSSVSMRTSSKYMLIGTRLVIVQSLRYCSNHSHYIALSFDHASNQRALFFGFIFSNDTAAHFKTDPEQLFNCARSQRITFEPLMFNAIMEQFSYKCRLRL